MPSAFWDRYAFTVGGTDFYWVDVMLDAIVRGEWPAFERRLAEGLACVARADREQSGPSGDEVDAAATAFRYDRDLIAGSEMTAWLDGSGLSTDEWVAYLTRQLLREQWAADLDDIYDAYAPSTRELIAAAVPEGVCSGAFDRFERTFAAHAALVFASDPDRFSAAIREAGDRPHGETVAHLMKAHGPWLDLLPGGDAAARLSAVVHIEGIMQTLVATIACEGRMREIVEANRLEWIQVELETVSFPSEAAAREGLLCIAEDGMSLAEVAALSRAPVVRSSIAVEDCAPHLRHSLLAAVPGGLLGPSCVDGRFELTRVVDRVTPTLDDPRVASRARQTLLDYALAHAARDHVTRRSGS